MNILSRNAYFDVNNEPCMEQSVIAVADILGFWSMIRKEGEVALRKIDKALREALKNVHDPSGAHMSRKLWSDNLIVAYRLLGQGGGAFEFPQACHSIGHFQREMANGGFFLRGGIAVGEIHVSENIIFGSVMEELRQTERIANYPRIILLDSAKEHMSRPCKSHDCHLGDILWKDDCDGAKFVNYLYPLDARDDANRGNQIIRHKQHIESNLREYQSNVRVYQKYIWLANYHNKFCIKSRHFNGNNFFVSI